MFRNWIECIWLIMLCCKLDDFLALITAFGCSDKNLYNLHILSGKQQFQAIRIKIRAAINDSQHFQYLPKAFIII